MRVMRALLVLATAGLASGVWAADSYKIDKVHSTVIFRIKHLNAGYSYGRFNEIAGTIDWDADKPEACKLDVTVKTDSIDTGDKKRDKHLEGPDFFNAKQHKTMTFKSKSVKKGEDGMYEVTGDLSCNGVTKEVTVKVEHTGTASTQMGGDRMGLETTFTVQRADFGITYMPDGLGSDVRLIVSLEGMKGGEGGR